MSQTWAESSRTAYVRTPTTPEGSRRFVLGDVEAARRRDASFRQYRRCRLPDQPAPPAPVGIPTTVSARRGDGRLDIGGEAQFWRQREVRPAQVHDGERRRGGRRGAVDQERRGRRVPPPRRPWEVRPGVLELGDRARRRALAPRRFAEQVSAAAPRYWVRRRPLHPRRAALPHSLLPAPPSLRPGVGRGALACRNFRPVRDGDVPFGYALEIELLSRAETRRHFPDAKLLAAEKVAGLTKSWIAVRRP